MKLKKALLEGFLAASLLIPCHAQKKLLPVNSEKKEQYISNEQYEYFTFSKKILDSIVSALEKYKKRKKSYPLKLEQLKEIYSGPLYDPFGPRLNLDDGYISDEKDFVLISAGPDYIDHYLRAGERKGFPSLDEYLVSNELIYDYYKLKTKEGKFFIVGKDIIKFSSREGFERLTKKRKIEMETKKKLEEQKAVKEEERKVQELFNSTKEKYFQMNTVLDNYKLILEEYRKRKGAYPLKLEELKIFSNWLSTDLLGADFFGRYGDNDLRYISDGKDFIIYSIGPDEEDNLGLKYKTKKFKNVDLTYKEIIGQYKNEEGRGMKWETKVKKIDEIDFIYRGDLIRYNSEEGYERLIMPNKIEATINMMDLTEKDLWGNQFRCYEDLKSQITFTWSFGPDKKDDFGNLVNKSVSDALKRLENSKLIKKIDHTKIGESISTYFWFGNMENYTGDIVRVYKKP